MPIEGLRSKRVAASVREELASIVAYELKDPRASGAVVTAVEMAGDLRSAKVRVRLLEGGQDAARRNALLEALGRASSLLRREITQRLALRTAPELKFYYDEGVERATRIEELLAEISDEQRHRPPR
jgi:ribosome-binding factor A